MRQCLHVVPAGVRFFWWAGLGGHERKSQRFEVIMKQHLYSSLLLLSRKPPCVCLFVQQMFSKSCKEKKKLTKTS